MLYLIGQISVFLLIAAIEGLIIGWLIARYYYIQKMVDIKVKWEEELRDKRMEMAILQNVLNKKVTEITTLQQQLHDCQKNYIELKNRKQDRETNRDLKSAGARIETFNSRDNLKQISGIGPHLEKKLNDLGIISISQIASWKHSDINRFAKMIGPFPNRIYRDNWVGKAREIMSAKLQYHNYF